MSETTTTTEPSSTEPYRGTVTSPTIVKLSGIAKTFYRGSEPIKVLDGLDLDVPNGSFEALHSMAAYPRRGVRDRQIARSHLGRIRRRTTRGTRGRELRCRSARASVGCR